MTAEEKALLKDIGRQVAGPRHTLSLPAEPLATELVNSLVEQKLVESTGYVQRAGGTGLIRVCLTGRGWVKYKESNTAA